VLRNPLASCLAHTIVMPDAQRENQHNTLACNPYNVPQQQAPVAALAALTR
jgi:hypothetical protein